MLALFDSNNLPFAMIEEPDSIERFFAALAVTGFAGLIACMVWLMLSP
jgi:hypothetical protein